MMNLYPSLNPIFSTRKQVKNGADLFLGGRHELAPHSPVRKAGGHHRLWISYVSCVNERRRATNELRESFQVEVFEFPVRRAYHDAVRTFDCLREAPFYWKPENLLARKHRVVNVNGRPQSSQADANPLQGRELNVFDVWLVRNAKYCYLRSPRSLAHFVQRLGHEFHDVVRHPVVDLPGHSYDVRNVPGLYSFDNQVV